eukprot:3022125-Pleurochrysis_carterae.AAC.6
MRPEVESRSPEGYGGPQSKKSRNFPPRKALSSSLENAETREKAEEHDGAGGACARGFVATTYGRRPGILLKTSPSLLSIDECFIPAAARP